MNEYFISISTKLADEIDSNSDYQNDDLITFPSDLLKQIKRSLNEYVSFYEYLRQ